MTGSASSKTRADEPIQGLRLLVFYAFPALLTAATIFFLSSLRGSQLRLPLFPHSDKVAHFLAYGLLGLLLLRALAAGTRWSALRCILITVAACTAYGISDEIHQLFVPLRTAEALDVAADTAGAATACMAWWWRVRRRKAKP